MREFFLDFQKALKHIGPTFLHVPPHVPYPHMTIEPGSFLQGVPRGPSLLNFSLKIWSQYTGVREILKMVRNVETVILHYPKGSLKVLKSSLTLLTDKKTRVHAFNIKARVPHE